ncbi:MAG: hypothetical protein Q9164_002084 [Protoblastenia rupestris]
MSLVHHVANLVVRQAVGTESATSPVIEEAAESVEACVTGNEYDGRLGLRISAIFVILFGSTLGHKLLAPANDALRNPCLTGPITDYPWVEGISLMTVFVLFFVELMAMRYATFGHTQPQDHEQNPHNHDSAQKQTSPRPSVTRHSHTPGQDHLSHTRSHKSHSPEPSPKTDTANPAYAYNTTNTTTIHDIEDYNAQITAITILEFGVIFHSIFVGLTLAVAGEEFTTLYTVLVFHQTFEGLGLGSRLAATPFPKTRRWTPYLFALAYGLSTPIAMAVGLGLSETYAPGSKAALVVNGVFDSISAGILIYTGLVELMAHEFMFSAVMRRARIRVVLGAFGMMCAGAGEFDFLFIIYPLTCCSLSP